MQLYNTASKVIEEVSAQQAPVISVYTCGPTVYDYAHVGHWFTYVRMDTLIRTLKLAGLEPNWIVNITDVGHLVSDGDEGEDKLQKGAEREGKTAWEIADFYTQDFLHGMQQLNITVPNKMPKATDHIQEQIDLIMRLEQQGYTYQIDDGIYFDTAKFPRYADFAGLNLAEQQGGMRVELNIQKRSPSDFALWKFSPQGEKRDMEWESPWGVGFPGWHIECSAMSMKYLGETLDIHTGGIDHIPVHHTNEIAQSEAVTGKTFAKHWVHSNHILIEGEKISKSLGNGIRLQELEEREINPLSLRLYILESHYRKQATFNWDGLLAADTRRKSYQAAADLRYQLVSSSTSHDFESYHNELLAALKSDLDTPLFLAALSHQIDTISQQLVGENQVTAYSDYLNFIDAATGLKLQDSADIDEKAQHILANRLQARNNQDWQTADHYRDQLNSLGIGVRDSEVGQIWYRL